MTSDLRAKVNADMPRLLGLLTDLVAMRSISATSYDQAPVHAAAGAIMERLKELGFANSQLLTAESGNPCVYAELAGPPKAPTVLLYAHYDVQPPGPDDEWEHPPFQATEVDGRIYGRGASDDKAGIVMHLGAAAAYDMNPPVTLKIFLEGEEESGSPSLPTILQKYSDLLTPDVIVIGDGGNWDVGVPAILTSLRGTGHLDVEVRTLKAAMHSGVFGGVYPDALTSLIRLLATLHEENGEVAVEGLKTADLDSVQIPDEAAADLIGAVVGVHQIGTGSITDRLWAKPSISILALDAPPVKESINQLVPVARAAIGLRLAPNQSSKEGMDALKRHLIANAPWGVTVDFIKELRGDPTFLETDNFAVEAWQEAFKEAYGVDAVFKGEGGSIPFIADFVKLFPQAPILVVGCGDPTSSIHAPNESQDIGDLERSVLSEALALRIIAENYASSR